MNTTIAPFTYPPSNNTNILTPANIAIGVILPQVGGVLNALFILCIPIITNTLRKYALWDFENVWLIFSLFAFLIYPIVAFFSIIPVSNMTAYVNGSFNAVDWIGPCFLIALFTILGMTLWAWAVSWSGIGIASLIVFGLFPIVSTFVNWAVDGTITERYLGTNGISPVPAIIFTIGAAVVLVGLVLAFIATIFAEQHHRYKRTEIMQGILEDAAKDRERFNVSNPKPVRVITKKEMAIYYWIGIVMAIFSGLCFLMLPLGTYVSKPLVLNLMNVGGMTLFQAKIGITSIGFVMGFIICLALCTVLLFAKKTIAKYAICSGGFIALFNCVNFKGFRLLGLFLSILIATLWFGSFLLLIFAETQLTTTKHQMSQSGMPNIQNSLYAIWTIILTALWSGVMGEYKSTKTPERIMMPIATVITILGLVMISYGGYPSF